MILGTDIGPPCGCCSTLWVYGVARYDDDDPDPGRAVYQVAPRCACCNADRAEFFVYTAGPEPTIQEVRAAHQARMDRIRDEIQRLIHG